jgi:hypothetical protein
MGIYKDIEVTEKLIRDRGLVHKRKEETNRKFYLNEVKEPVITNSKDTIDKFYDILKTLRSIEYTIRNDENISDEIYLPKMKEVIENTEKALNEFEPMISELEELGY